MAAYMRDQFAFLGIAAPERRGLTRDVLRGLSEPSEIALAATARTLWALPEREYQYAAVDVLIRHLRECGPVLLPEVRALIQSRSWWDTVDVLASRVVGPLVARYPELQGELDRWIDDGGIWVARSALLYQLGYKQRTDTGRLFRYCERRAGDREFFIRKAIGWALRQYAKTDPGAVQAFVAAHERTLSPLSRREALRGIGTALGPHRSGDIRTSV